MPRYAPKRNRRPLDVAQQWKPSLIRVDGAEWNDVDGFVLALASEVVPVISGTSGFYVSPIPGEQVPVLSLSYDSENQYLTLVTGVLSAGNYTVRVEPYPDSFRDKFGAYLAPVQFVVTIA